MTPLAVDAAFSAQQPTVPDVMFCLVTTGLSRPAATLFGVTAFTGNWMLLPQITGVIWICRSGIEHADQNGHTTAQATGIGAAVAANTMGSGYLGFLGG